jgi:hypothetical protein
MQTEKSGYKEIEDLLEGVELPRMALVEQHIDTPATLPDIGEAVRDALRWVGLPSASVAVGVGSRGVAGIGEVVKALVNALKQAGAEPFVVPAMGSHGASTAEGQVRMLEHLRVGEKEIGCPIKATMESILLGETPSGVEVFMDKNAYEADAVIVVNRVKPHTALRGIVESGPMKMLAVGLGKQKGAHPVHAAGREDIRHTIPEVAHVAVESGKVAFGLAVLENAWEEPYKVVAVPAEKMAESEAPLLEEAKQNLLRLPFDAIDVLVVDEIGKNISGDGADPNVTGRYPPPLRYRWPRSRADGLSGPHRRDRRQRQRRRVGRRGNRAPRVEDGQAHDLPQRPHLHHPPTRKATDGHADRQARDGRRP